jgi:heterodisulfide reductase subunit A
MSEQRIGVYLCECGGEISNKVNLEKVTDAIDARTITLPMLCTPEGLEEISKGISEFTHVVFAACTPKRIEKTFEDVVKKANLNPYLTHIVNLREQCAWVSEDKEKATDKAIHLIKGALRRIAYHEPLEEKYIDANPDVVVVGGGVAGVLAALTLSEDTNRRVYLIEKNPHIGGKTITYEDLTPNLTCAPCLLAPPLQDVLGKPNVILYTNAEVEEVKGTLGNFLLRISQKARYVDVDKCIGCNACIEVCPVNLPNDFEYRMKERKAIYFPYAGVLPNAPVIDWQNCLYEKERCQKCVESCVFDAINFDDMQREFDLKCGSVLLSTGFSTYPVREGGRIYSSPKFERLLAKNGPTEGEIVLPDGNKPKSIAIVHCAGREELGYCSKICCSVAMKYSHMIHEQLPDCEIHHIYTDLVLPEMHSKLYNEVSKFARFHRSSKFDVREDGGVTVEYTDEEGNQKLNVDMAVLMSGIMPSPELKKIAEIFDLKLNEYGFLEVSDMKLSPVETTSAGVLAAGGILGACSVEESVQQAVAAAGKVLSKLRHGEKLFVDPKVCTVDEEKCSGCKFCIPLCPYGAAVYEEEKCTIDETLCQGCGVCASACPAKAIEARHYTTEQIYAEIEGVTK